MLFWVVAPTTPLNVHVHRYIQALCPKELIDRVYDDAIWLKPDLLIEFKSAERPDLLVGASVSGLLLDEACRIKADSWNGALQGRIADTGGWALMASSPTGGRNNWIYSDFVSRSGTHDIEAFSWKTIDNTAVPSLVAEAAAAKERMPPAWYAREFEASFDSFGGAIYEEFRDETHVLSEAAFRLEFGLGSAPFTADAMRRIFRRVVAGVDFGWTKPGAMVVIGHLGDARMVVLDESYAAQRPINGEPDMVTWVSEGKRLQQRWGVEAFYCDTEDPAAIRDLSTAGLPATGAWKNVYLGIRRVSEGLHVVNGKPGLRVMESCVNMIREKRNYQWKALRDQSGFTEEPADNQDDHALDAERYAVVALRPFATTTTDAVRGQAAYR